MLMLVEDLTVFTEGEFATDAVLIRQNLPDLTIKGIFDYEYAPILESGTEGRIITFTVITSIIQPTHHGDRLTIGNKTYQIKGIQPIMDGKITDLELKE
jgi:hypothetical protein